MQTTRGPNGEGMVPLSLDEYQDLTVSRGHAAAMQAVASGAMETLSEEDAAAYLAAKTPLAFGRRHRAVTQRALSGAIGVSQAYIAQIENGVREGSPVMLRNIARVLRIRMEDLVPWRLLRDLTAKRRPEAPFAFTGTELGAQARRRRSQPSPTSAPPNRARLPGSGARTGRAPAYTNISRPFPPVSLTSPLVLSGWYAVTPPAVPQSPGQLSE